MTIDLAEPMALPSRSASPTPAHHGQWSSEPHRITAVVVDLPRDHGRAEAQWSPVARVNLQESVGGQSSSETHASTAADVFLKLAAESLNDIERTRIATSHRVAAWDRAPENGGLGLPTDLPEYTRLVAIHDAMLAAEKLATKELARALRRHPLGQWVKATCGVGEKQGARLIAAIGDPYIKPARIVEGEVVEDPRPRRGPAERWAYCGYKPGQRRTRGERSNWNAEAKMRARLVAESCMKATSSPYRAVYDAARAKHVAAVHDSPCPQCGPAGRPARAGSPLSLGHQHARALREVAKAVLRDLFVAARDARQAS